MRVLIFVVSVLIVILSSCGYKVFVPKDRVIFTTKGYVIYYQRGFYLFENSDSTFDFSRMRRRPGLMLDDESYPQIKALRRHLRKIDVNNVFIAHSDTTLIPDSLYYLSTTWDYYYNKSFHKPSRSKMLINNAGLTHEIITLSPSPIVLLGIYPQDYQKKVSYLLDIGILKGR